MTSSRRQAVSSARTTATHSHRGKLGAPLQVGSKRSAKPRLARGARFESWLPRRSPMPELIDGLFSLSACSHRDPRSVSAGTGDRGEDEGKGSKDRPWRADGTDL